jgi:hypothetical protein
MSRTEPSHINPHMQFKRQVGRTFSWENIDV